MKRTIVIISGIILAASAAGVDIASAAQVTADTYRVSLTQAGFTVSVDTAAVSHATLSAQGKAFTLQKGGASVRLELIEYPDSRALRADFDAVNGAGPRPRIATGDFAGRVLYWNENAVLAVGFSPPNEPGLAQSAADVFLGRRGTGGPAPAAAAGGVKLPAAGNAGAPGEASSPPHASPGIETVVVLAAGVGALLLGAAGSLRRSSRR